MVPTFLLTTSKAFCIVEDGKPRTLYQVNNGLMFGITWDETHVYVLSRNGSPGQNETIEVFDRNLHRVDRINLGRGKCKGGHQLFHCPRTGLTYLLNTDLEKITVFRGREVERHVPWPDSDICTHINSIWSPDGEDFYVCEHNGCNPPSAIVRCNAELEPQQRFENVGRDCHCIYVEDNELITASSKEHGIVRHCLVSDTRVDFKRIEALGSNKWYTRGLGMRPNYMLLGLSAHQDIREKRAQSQEGGVVILDPEFNVMEEIAVGYRGQILDLRIIDDLDLAHNGVPF